MLHMTNVNEMFKTPWGIVERRRSEIEQGSHGAFDRIYKEELAKQFLSLAEAAKLMRCCDSTARKWLMEADARFIVDGLTYRYYEKDVQDARRIRAESKPKPKEQ